LWFRWLDGVHNGNDTTRMFIELSKATDLDDITKNHISRVLRT